MVRFYNHPTPLLPRVDKNCEFIQVAEIEMSFVVQADLLELTCTVPILCKIIGSLWEW